MDGQGSAHHSSGNPSPLTCPFAFFETLGTANPQAPREIWWRGWFERHDLWHNDPQNYWVISTYYLQNTSMIPLRSLGTSWNQFLNHRLAPLRNLPCFGLVVSFLRHPRRFWATSTTPCCVAVATSRRVWFSDVKAGEWGGLDEIL